MSTSVRYKGVEIATLENETKTLNTAGKWVEGDITLEDVTGGGANLQSKSVQYVPSGTSQSATVVPDSGYDGLSQVSVTVDPVPEGEFDIDIANAGFYDDAGVRKWHARASFDAWDGWIPPDSYYGPYRERNAVPAGTVITPSSTAQTVGGANWVMEGPVTIEAASGGSSWTLIASQDFTVNTTSTSNTTVGTISCGSTAFTDKKVLYVRVRDKAGARLGYFYGSDAYFYNNTKANGGSTTVSTAGRFVHRLSTSGQWGLYCSGTTTCYGVFGYSITSAGALQVRARYNSNYSLTINGTFTVEVYALDLPDGVMPYDAY